MINEIGDQLASLNRKEAEDLREYIIKEHGLVVGHVETAVGRLSIDYECEYDFASNHYSEEFDYWFSGPYGAYA